MITWIALLRGVNVGGNKKLPMAGFRDLLSGLGYANVATYIQSGNAVFSADGSATSIARAIEGALGKEFGFISDTFAMPMERMARALDTNPFPAAETDPKLLHIMFLAGPVADLDRAGMAEFGTSGEQFHLTDTEFYLFTPNGFSNSKLAAKLNRFIKVSATARNLRSCQKILELAKAI